MPELPDVAAILLDLFSKYGYALLAAATFASAAGVPLPMTAVLLAAGAATTEGSQDFALAAAIVLLAAVAGDCTSYLIGFELGRRLLRRWGHRIGISQERLERSERILRRWGGGIIWITRWLLTPIALPVNLLAGANRFPLPLFVAFATAGEAIWAMGYLALGRIFGQDTSGPAGTIGKVGGAMLVALLILGGGYASRRLLRRRSAASAA
ncbi:MAG TPA: VTT domain-containing protein [Chloroflexota bacterium]|nr:VTT domain-containing protein [Chloroflexota bacterium]